VKSGKSLIIDCDPGLDDAIALMLAHGPHFKYHLTGICTVYGNVSADNTYRNANWITAALKSAIPVFKGAESSLNNEVHFAQHIHGNDGLGGLVHKEFEASADLTSSLDFLASHLKKGSQTLACIGPLTHLATLVNTNQTQNLDQVVVMGGGLNKGNITPYAEFNFFNDPLAAFKVLRANLPLTLLPLNVTHQIDSQPSRWEFLKDSQEHHHELLHKLLQKHYEGEKSFHPQLDKMPLHDPCTLIYLQEPDIFKTTKKKLTVILEGSQKGQLIEDPNGTEVHLVLSVDKDLFWGKFKEILGF
jgi:purine nucleosidase